MIKVEFVGETHSDIIQDLKSFLEAFAAIELPEVTKEEPVKEVVEEPKEEKKPAKKAPPKTKPKEETAVDAETIRTLMSDIMGKGTDSRKTLKDLLLSFDVAKFTDMPESQYGAFYEALKGLA